MKFLNKDIDRRLLVLIIVLLMLFTVFTIYYESTLTAVLDYHNKEINDITGKLFFEEINKTAKLKEVAMKDKVALEEGYYDLKTKNEDLKKNNNELKTRITAAKAQIKEMNSTVNGLEAQLRLAQNTNDEAKRLAEMIKDVCDVLLSYNISYDGC